MRRALHTLITLIWGLWFGGLIALFLTVTSLFRAFADRHEIAGIGAARVFRTFNAYQLALAAAALVLTFVWRILGRPGRKSVLFVLFAAATVAACVVTIFIAPRIELLQRQGSVASPQFAKLHGLSMVLYLAETLALLIGGLLLPGCADDRPRGTSPEAARD